MIEEKKNKKTEKTTTTATCFKHLKNKLEYKWLRCSNITLGLDMHSVGFVVFNACKSNQRNRRGLDSTTERRFCLHSCKVASYYV